MERGASRYGPGAGARRRDPAETGFSSPYPIADGFSLPYYGTVVRPFVLVAAIVLWGCGPSDGMTAPRKVGAGHLPLDRSKGFLDGYSLKVSRQGKFLWNGGPVAPDVLRDYLRQYAALPRGAGSLFVAFEPGGGQARAEWVRRQVIDSGLCEQHRCAEVGWNVKRRVVN